MIDYGLHREGKLVMSFVKMIDEGVLYVDDGKIGALKRDGDIWEESTLYIPDSFMDERITTVAESGFSFISGLKEVHLPSTITTIENQAFEENFMLESVVLPNDSELSTIGEAAFKDDYALREMIKAKSVTVIESQTYANCYMESVDLTDITVENNAFENANVNSINLCNTTLKDNAFEKCDSSYVFGVVNGNTNMDAIGKLPGIADYYLTCTESGLTYTGKMVALVSQDRMMQDAANIESSAMDVEEEQGILSQEALDFLGEETVSNDIYVASDMEELDDIESNIPDFANTPEYEKFYSYNSEEEMYAAYEKENLEKEETFIDCAEVSRLLTDFDKKSDEVNWVVEQIEKNGMPKIIADELKDAKEKVVASTHKLASNPTLSNEKKEQYVNENIKVMSSAKSKLEIMAQKKAIDHRLAGTRVVNFFDKQFLHNLHKAEMAWQYEYNRYAYRKQCIIENPNVVNRNHKIREIDDYLEFIEKEMKKIGKELVVTEKAYNDRNARREQEMEEYNKDRKEYDQENGIKENRGNYYVTSADKEAEEPQKKEEVSSADKDAEILNLRQTISSMQQRLNELEAEKKAKEQKELTEESIDERLSRIEAKLKIEKEEMAARKQSRKKAVSEKKSKEKEEKDTEKE